MTTVLLFGVGIKNAGCLSLVGSLPTMLVAFTRYSRDQSLGMLRRNGHAVLAMTLGFIIGTVIGELLLGVIADVVLVPASAPCPCCPP